MTGRIQTHFALIVTALLLLVVVASASTPEMSACLADAIPAHVRGNSKSAVQFSLRSVREPVSASSLPREKEEDVMKHHISNRTLTLLLAESSHSLARVYLALLSRVDRHTCAVRISTSELANATALSIRTVFATLAQLERYEIIRRSSRVPGPSVSVFLICDYDTGLHSATDEPTQAHSSDLNEFRLPTAETSVSEDRMSDRSQLGVPGEPAEGHKCTAPEPEDTEEEARHRPDGLLATSQAAVALCSRSMHAVALCAQVHDAVQSEADATKRIMQSVASCYRALTVPETAEIQNFIDNVFDGDVERFLAAADSVRNGVSPDSDIEFLLAVVHTADRRVRHTRA